MLRQLQRLPYTGIWLLKAYFETSLSLLKTNSELLQVQDYFNTSWKWYKDYLKRSSNSKSETTAELSKHDFKTSSRLHQDWFKSTLKSSLKSIFKDFLLAASKTIQDSFKTTLRLIFKTTSEQLQDGFMTSFNHLPTHHPPIQSYPIFWCGSFLNNIKWWF